jgi:hypothetical protein
MSVSTIGPAIAQETEGTIRSVVGKRFPIRFLFYLIERFSLLSVVPASLLHYLFIANYASGGLDIAIWPRWLIGFTTFLGVFLCLRLSDDMKDKRHDDVYYADRPVQRGLVTLRELAISLAVLVVLLVTLNVLFANVVNLALFLTTLGLLTLMRFEFFAPEFLRPRLLLYLGTHQMFVPVLTAYVIYFEGGKVASLGAVLFLMLNLLMIMAVEVARKTRSTDLDQTGRDTYSSYLGRGGAIIFLLAILFAAQGLFSLGAGVPIWLAVSLALPVLACVYYLRADSNSSAKAVLNASVLFLTINMLAAMAISL